MKNVLNLVAALPLLMSSAMAASTSISCRTQMGTRSVSPVPRTTTTTTGARPTKTVIVQKTSTTSEAVTSTSTVYVTSTKTVTDATQTDVFFTTTTVISQRVIPVTSVVTTTSTSTVTTSTTSTATVATSAGFAPLADTINAGPAPGKRDFLSGGSLAQRAAKKVSKKQVGILAANRPVAVTCTKSVAATRTVTVTSTGTPKTSTVRNTVTATATSTITTTSTVITGDVSSTSTATVTSTVNTVSTTYSVATATVTATQTNTVVGPTVYAACGASNIFGPGFTSDGADYYAVNVMNNAPNTPITVSVADGASSAAECCVACQKSTDCENFVYRPNTRNCLLLNHPGDTCPNQFNRVNFITSTAGADQGDGVLVGNGNCGYAYSGNAQGASQTVDTGSGFVQQ